MICRILLVIAVCVLAGCRNGKLVDPTANFVDPSPAESAQGAGSSSPDAKSASGKKVVKAADPQLLIRPQVSLSVVQMSVPAGIVSRNEKFWKRIQENAVDVSAHDLLQKNGIRVGMASLMELDAIRNTIERGLVENEPVTYVTAGVRVAELPMRQDVAEQTLYYFDKNNVFTMRSYVGCEDIFVLELQPSPRRAGDVRIGISPMVRSLRKRLVPVSDNEAREFEYISPEILYDLNLRTDLPADSALIIAPSTEASSPTSIGHAFLTRQANTVETEVVLILIPQIMTPKPPKASPDAPAKDQPKPAN